MAEPTPEDVDIISVPEWERLGEAFTGLATKRTHRIVVRREAVPIVFVPGIMGTRLGRLKNGVSEKVWDPDDSLFMLHNYGMFYVSPKDKKDMVIGPVFDPTYLHVLDLDPEHNEDHLADFPLAVERGWGGVSWGTYGDILRLLDSNPWPGLAGKIFVTPVYACGYNWSDTVVSSGDSLKARIKDIIKEQQAAGMRCDKVILVTHSMGGLVARSACKLSGAEGDVLGVVHGVQPTTGAPAAYWRMRAGFERPGFFDIKGRLATFVLGANGEETTALLGNMPGGLQLLPSKAYRSNDNGAAWLTVYNESGDKIKELPSSPTNPDPYQDIYREKHALWRLANPAFLDPGKKPAPSKEKRAAAAREDAWDYYLGYLDEAKSFHDAVGLKPIPGTHIFWGKGTADPPAHPSADRIRLTCGRYFPTSLELEYGRPYMRGPALSSADGLQLVEGFHAWECRGGYKAHVVVPGTRTGYTLEMAEPAGSGDGTVPESSGKILESRGAGSNYVEDVEHEPAFKHGYAQTVTKEAIERMLKGLIAERLGAGGGG